MTKRTKKSDDALARALRAATGTGRPIKSYKLSASDSKAVLVHKVALAKEAIADVFGFTDVPRQRTRAALEELAIDIKTALEALTE